MNRTAQPLLLVDIDGVISLFGFDPSRPPDGRFITVDGMIHFLSRESGQRLLALSELFELVWCSGWEEKAEEHLPHLLALPAGLPFLRFERGVGGTGSTNAHWKLDAIDTYVDGRPLAWIDDAFNDACHALAPSVPARTRDRRR